MVRLKGYLSFMQMTVLVDFNSTMVRLKVHANSNCEKFSQFQFHYGTIKSLTLEKISALIFKNLADTKL